MGAIRCAMGREKEAPGTGPLFKLSLIGPFSLETADGVRVGVSSKRGQALLALLATSAKGERARGWLESMLWCDRPAEQAKSSLRKELSNLRKVVNAYGAQLLNADNALVWLTMDALEIEAQPAHGDQEFLEGLDIPGEEVFEDWLRDQRMAVKAALDLHKLAAVTTPTPVPEEVVTPSAKPSIAVLPFSAAMAGGDLEYAVHGLIEDLINRLSRLRWLPVIAKSSSFALEKGAGDARSAGEKLGARYIVEGTVRPLEHGYRLTVTLSDTQVLQTLWSDTIDLPDLMDVSAIDAPLAGITASLDHRIDQSEQQRALKQAEGNENIQALIWKARWHLVRLTDADIARAHELLDQAQAIEPNAPEVLIEKAWLEIRRLWLHRASEEDIRSVRKMAQKAIFADPDDARGHMIAGIAEFWLRQPLRAEGLLRRAIELNPSLVMAHAQLGSALHHIGNRAEAIEALETAKRLSPNDFDLFFVEGELAMAHWGEGNFEQAILHAEASLSRRAAYWSAHVAKINALLGLDELAEAKRAYHELLGAMPNFSPKFVDWLPYLDASNNAALREGLNQAAH